MRHFQLVLIVDYRCAHVTFERKLVYELGQAGTSLVNVNKVVAKL